MSEYDRAFYQDRYARTLHSANAILDHVLELLPPVRRAVDLGCGVGTWLSVLRERGAEQVCGLDGAWVDLELLAIPRANFRQANLSQPIALDHRYDLAISLEVAEHLPPERAPGFVSDLCALSDFVLFAAAIPRQGGVHHVNEQWPDYWARLFVERGYEVHDVVRSCFWNDEKIPFWYKQNTFLFVERGRRQELKLRTERVTALPLRLVHPELFLERAAVAASADGGIRTLSRLLFKRVRAKLGGVG